MRSTKLGLPVAIHVSCNQADPSQNMSFTCFGRLYQKDQKKVLLYKELEESGLGNTLTQLHLLPDGSIRLVRTGDLAFTMNLKRGNRELSSVQTPYGRLLMGILVNEADYDVRSDGGDIRIRYMMDAGDQSPTEMNLTIKYTINKDTMC